MRLVTVRTATGTQAGRMDGADIVLLEAPDVGTLLGGPNWRDLATQPGPRIAAAGCALAPVIPRPEKIFCLAQNFTAHAAEADQSPPPFPAIFAKFARSLLGPNDDLVLPSESTFIDWEVELVAVIGTAARNVTFTAALDHVAGFTIGNDVSMRDWQMRTSQYLQGKIFEATTPLGPCLVTTDEIGPLDDLTIRCAVNDDVVQESTLSQMIFSVADVVSYLSRIITLVPGDLLFMGTPEGVGYYRDPAVSLTPGAVLTTEIDGIGQLRNVCIASSAAPDGPTADVSGSATVDGGPA